MLDEQINIKTGNCSNYGNMLYKQARRVMIKSKEREGKERDN
jgi:hypothetical protein